MDPDVSRWVLDFLVRQPIDDSTLTSLLRTLPISDTDTNLKKLLLLRKIESHISTDSGPTDLGPTDEVLRLFEHIEELDHRANVETIESMKRAYCAVAVHCTFKGVESEGFEEVVKKIWRGRIGVMVKYGGVGLVSDELRGWMGDFEVALGDGDVRKGLVEKWNGGVGVVEAVRGFVEEAKAIRGPSFIEFAVDTLGREDGLMREVFGIGETQQDVQKETPSDVQKETVHRRSKVRAVKQYKKVTPKTSRGVKIVDNDDPSDASLHNKYGCLSTSEVTKLQENLRSSTSELQEMVKDPLPEALEIAKNVASKMDSVDKRTDVIPAENSNLENKGSTHQTNATKASLMERNKTARTYEWDEPSDESADPGSRPHLSSLNKRLVTPLKKHESPKPRRKRKFWSNLEEDTLRAGVQKYGMGNWKLILNMYRDIFDERTEVDLKDKWRNMTT